MLHRFCTDVNRNVAWSYMINAPHRTEMHRNRCIGAPKNCTDVCTDAPKAPINEPKNDVLGRVGCTESTDRGIHTLSVRCTDPRKKTSVHGCGVRVG